MVHQVRRTADFERVGIDHKTILRGQAGGTIVRVRHGAYTASAEPEARCRHEQLIAGTWPLLGEQTVLSHWSAAVLWGLPIWSEHLTRVSALHPGHGRKGHWLHARTGVLDDRTTHHVGPYAVTSLARTAVDVARVVPFEQGVSIIDAALAREVEPGLLLEWVEYGRRCKGNARARRAVAFGDHRSESPGESVSRVIFDASGLPAPVLQYPVPGTPYITDFGWPEDGLLGEFDGRIKYTGILDPSKTGADVIMREKHREDVLRGLGWIVVRWQWSDLAQPEALAQRVSTAFEQSHRLRVA